MRIGRHRVFAEIAAGGMASVHLACLVGPGAFTSVTALKRLHPHLARHDDFRRMLLDEARLSARVVHPNVVRTLDVIEDGDEVVIVMEYVLGVSLARVVQLLRASGELVPLDVAAGIAAGLLHGLHAAHEALGADGTPLGIVHRDVSPQNVIVGADGVPRILDFGIAKARSRLTTTEDGVVKGKQGYMAPEQLLSEPLSRETDVFGAAVVLWELVAGERLFVVDGARTSLAQRVTDDVTMAPSSRRLAVGSEPEGTLRALDDVILRGLRQRPSERFPTARAMAEALTEAVTPATAERIAEWLDATAGDELALARERVAAVERLAEQDEGDTSRMASSITPAAIEPPAKPRAPRSRLRTRAFVGLAAAVVVLAGALGTVTIVSKRAAGAGAHLGAGVSSPPPVEVTQGELPAAEAPPSPPASTADVEGTAPEPASSVGKSRASKPARPARPPKKSQRCTPPYTFDDEGHKIYKPECY